MRGEGGAVGAGVRGEGEYGGGPGGRPLWAELLVMEWEVVSGKGAYDLDCAVPRTGCEGVFGY